MKKNPKPTALKDNIKPDGKWRSAAEYVITFLAVFVIFVFCRGLNIKNNEQLSFVIMLIAFGALAFYALWLYSRGKMTAEKAIGLVIAAGFILRIGYMVYTHMFTRGHDLGTFSADVHKDWPGHLGYIYYIFQNNSLPDVNTYQLYHPPLYHISAALMVKFASIFVGTSNMQAPFEFAQIVNCFVSCAMLLTVRNFISELDIDKKFLPWIMLVTAFSPTLIQMGGRLNNDMFATFFMLLCIVNTYRWYSKRDMKSIIYLALSFGFGMMSKISCGTMALFTGPVMLYVLYKDFKNRNVKNTVIQLAVFAVICLPLGLWYPIRNLIMFNQPLTYVLEMKPSDYVYRGNLPKSELFFSFSLPQLYTQPFVDIFKDNSVWMTLLRTSVFGEATFEKKEIVAGILNIVNLVISVGSLAAMVFVLIKGKKIRPRYRYGLFALWLIMMASYIQFNYAYPAFCTAHFRYIPLTSLIGSIYIAYAMCLLSGKKYKNYIYIAFMICICLWCLLIGIIYA